MINWLTNGQCYCTLYTEGRGGVTARDSRQCERGTLSLLSILPNGEDIKDLNAVSVRPLCFRCWNRGDFGPTIFAQSWNLKKKKNPTFTPTSHGGPPVVQSWESEQGLNFSLKLRSFDLHTTNTPFFGEWNILNDTEEYLSKSVHPYSPIWVIITPSPCLWRQAFWPCLLM